MLLPFARPALAGANLVATSSGGRDGRGRRSDDGDAGTLADLESALARAEAHEVMGDDPPF